MPSIRPTWLQPYTTELRSTILEAQGLHNQNYVIPFLAVGQDLLKDL